MQGGGKFLFAWGSGIYILLCRWPKVMGIFLNIYSLSYIQYLKLIFDEKKIILENVTKWK